ncbi:MAG: hypothetical protein HY020_16815 [Burkholderiales bacterium]|nr:hypothetical protein [Burkholderiales bacterium]
MDALSFIAKLVEALAWPVASIAVVWLLRTEIRNLVPLIKKLKAGPLEAEFEREVKELRGSVKASPSHTAEETVAQWLPVASQLAAVHPRAAILEAWRIVESKAIRLLQDAEPSLSDERLRSTREVVRLLGGHGFLSLEEVATLNQMRFLRNQAVHVPQFEPTYEGAMNFVQLAANLLQQMHSRAATANGVTES